MPRIDRMWAIVTIVLAVSPRDGRAQLAPYLSALSTPPTTVGRCTPAPQPMQLRADAPVAGLRGHQLVIAGNDSGASRQLAVYADARGRARQYSELRGVITGGGSVSDEVQATLDDTGIVRGFVLHHTLVPHARPHHTRRPLDAEMQARVRDLSAWMLARCPG